MNTPAFIERLIAQVVNPWLNGVHSYLRRIEELPAGQELLAASPEEQRTFVMAALARLQNPSDVSNWQLVDGVTTLLRRSLPFSHDDVLTLIGWVRRGYCGWYVEPHLPKLLASYLARHPRTPALEEALDALITHLEAQAHSADQRRRVLKLRELAGFVDVSVPLLAGDPWADAARGEVAALPPEQRTPWTLLLQQCAAASGSAPSQKWLKATSALVERLGAVEVRAALLRWFSLVDQPRAEPLEQPWGGAHHPLVMQPQNQDVLRGLVWVCAADDSREMARALGGLVVTFYRKLPGVGPRSARLANAAIWTLGQLPGQHGMAQLTLLKTRVRVPGA